MKITTVCITFSEKYLLEEMFSLIFYPSFKEEVSSIIKCFRRYRIYIIGLQYQSNNEFSFSFTFPNRDILLRFRQEFATLVKELPS